MLELLKFAIEVLFVGLAAVGVTWFYSRKQLEISHDEFQRTLFIQFNERYDALNDHLHKILDLENGNEGKIDLNTLKKEHPECYRKMHDYLNLCAEEYFWYNKGRVDERVWIAWNEGINWWYNNLDALQELWEKEKKNGNHTSYYLEEGEKLFGKGPKSNQLSENFN